MSKIDLGYGTTAEAPGEDIILSTEMPNGDTFTLALHPTQVARLFEFTVREGLIEPMVPVSDIDQANINLEEALAAIKRIVNDINPIHLGQVIRSRRRSPPIRLGYGKPVRVPGPGYAAHHVDGSADNDPNNVSAVRVDENRRGS